MNVIPPRKIMREAKKKEDENIEFRTFLKINADEEELDGLFLKLHNELFSDYDCSRCRNCCKQFHGTIPEEDFEKDAGQLGMARDEFVATYLMLHEEPGEENTFITKHKPCDFLQEDGECKLGECKPDNCKKFPYTDQPDRFQSMYSVLNAAEVCPVVFEILERLKEEYSFRYDGKKRY